jgi:hypothetical protein
MSKVFSRYATPFITGLFLVSLISGIALFFHFGPGGFHGMHEWLSMVLIVPFLLHLWKNWRPMTGYFRHMPMAVALVVSVLAAGAFLMPSDETSTAGGPPQFRLAHLVLAQPAENVAPALGLTTDTLTRRLTSAGFIVTDATRPLTEIATASGKTEADLAALLTEPQE